ncbi:MAG: hypothetical protein WC542_12985 [Paludibacter sp.]
MNSIYRNSSGTHELNISMHQMPTGFQFQIAVSLGNLPCLP